MEEIIKQKREKNKVTFIILAIIGILLFAWGFYSFNKKQVEKNWKDVTETNEYGYIEAQYLVGPYVEETLDNKLKNEYYIAINDDEIVGCVLVKQYSKTEIPIVTTDEEYDAAVAQGTKRMYGYSKNYEREVTNIFVEELNKDFQANTVNSINISQYIGRYYLNTVASNGDKGLGIGLMITGAILVFLIPAFSIKNNKEYKALKEEISILKQDGKYDMYDNDIKSSNSYTEKRYLTIVGNENIYNFEKDMIVIPIQKIANVYKSSMINGQISKNDYICIETNENEVYNIAFKVRDKKDYKFDTLLYQIKQRMVK